MGCQALFMFFAVGMQYGVMELALVLSASFLIVAACYRKSQKIALITLLSTLVLLLTLVFFSPLLRYSEADYMLDEGCRLALMVGFSIATYITGLRFSRPVQVVSALPIVVVGWLLAESFVDYFVHDEFVEVCLHRQEEAHE